jgi:general secretion pathway protein D
LKPLLVCCLALAVSCWATDDKAVAARLAHRAARAAQSGQTVRAYLLFGEAVARDPENRTYRANRDALAPAAHLLTQAKIENADISSDVFSAKNEAAHPQPPIELVSSPDWQEQERHPLKPIPHVQADTARHDIDIRASAAPLVQQVAALYGVRALADSDLKSDKPIHLELQAADFRTALEAVTAATHTFVFPVSSSQIYFAPDTEIKRNQLEPLLMLTFPLQEASTEKELIEAANAVRGLLGLRTVGWDSLNRTVVIRDRATRARVARALMESLLLPRGQVSFEVQFLTIDTDKSYHYGASLQTLFQFIDFGNLGGVQSVLPAVIAGGPTQFATFGGGATLFGVGVADATAFASFSRSFASTIFNATVLVADRQTANLHIGDQYPIATSLYTGFTQGAASIYNPAPQITMEDLGLVLKLTPRISGDGDIGLDLEANFKSLGSQTIDSIPEIGEREFKGTVDLREGQWAVIAGLDSSSHSFTRSGLAGIGQIPGIKQLLTETTKDDQTSKTLVVIKPTITRLPQTDAFSPEFLIGARRGERVVI